mmetsp:Transcript_43273/g.169363  ORF Transcript_43273/g.169363 Transcript_43273/m.169363 type:complete len:306 (-) Transcript_43273:2477-3394(-)
MNIARLSGHANQHPPPKTNGFLPYIERPLCRTIEVVVRWLDHGNPLVPVPNCLLILWISSHDGRTKVCRQFLVAEFNSTYQFVHIVLSPVVQANLHTFRVLDAFGNVEREKELFVEQYHSLRDHSRCTSQVGIDDISCFRYEGPGKNSPASCQRKYSKSAYDIFFVLIRQPRQHVCPPQLHVEDPPFNMKWWWPYNSISQHSRSAILFLVLNARMRFWNSFRWHYGDAELDKTICGERIRHLHRGWYDERKPFPKDFMAVHFIYALEVHDQVAQSFVPEEAPVGHVDPNVLCREFSGTVHHLSEI